MILVFSKDINWILYKKKFHFYQYLIFNTYRYFILNDYPNAPDTQ